MAGEYSSSDRAFASMRLWVQSPLLQKKRCERKKEKMGVLEEGYMDRSNTQLENNISLILRNT
jgi:hypothetical protein